LAKILVADDDPVMQMTVQSMLEQAGRAVALAPKPFKPATLRVMAAACLTSAGHPTAPVRQDCNAVPNS
jgi:CheY-like chemotaxis protein